MKLLTLPLLLLGFCASAQTITGQPDSSYRWGWDTAALNWKLELRDIYSYDTGGREVCREMSWYYTLPTGWAPQYRTLHAYNAAGKMLSEQEQNRLTGIWRDYKATSYTYDVNNNQTSYLYKTGYYPDTLRNLYGNVAEYDSNSNQIIFEYKGFQNGVWISTDRYSYGYNAANQLTYFMMQEWSQGNWFNLYQTLHTYDSLGHRSGSLNQQWSGSVWYDSGRTFYANDASGNPLVELIQILTFQGWKDYAQVLRTFDANNNCTSRELQNWNGAMWVPDNMRELYTFDSGSNQTSEAYQSWNFDHWENSTGTVWTYDHGNRMTSQLRHNWNTNDSTWVNEDLVAFTFDAMGNCTELREEGWFFSNWLVRHKQVQTFDSSGRIQSRVNQYRTGFNLRNSDSTRYYYGTVTGLPEVPEDAYSVLLYPNPSADSWQLTVSDIFIGAEAQVLDAQGKLVFSLRLRASNTKLDFDVPRGVYLLRISTADRFVETRLVKL